ncbi:DUF1848 domain-containing protein [Anaerocolumna sp. AGMB13020]|uniref:DUF1848 domain-containing protein n=1 Tax=Anaerocolumna sp. AGMB13020 TaxID=3081750 RepID=UPI002953E7D9|nr:DUF1848 domain-containing protein [Anaerocolumna sp. AGMB13020]WOO35583.1 DUF1848 domain-containing protein [Anaerocolumna sp. AGMB13020]
MVISASRRTDIPRFYTDWFFNRLDEGSVCVRNPMNAKQVSRIILNQDTVDCFVFWSKDPAPMLPKLSLLLQKGYPFYFQFTVTPYERELELNLRDKKDILDTFIELSRMIGSDKVIWRYDPIILNEKYTFDYHRQVFEDMCRQLCGYTTVCNISFVDIYQKIRKQEESGIFRRVTESEMLGLSTELDAIAGKYGITVKSCCEDILQKASGIQRASCIDPKLIKELLGREIKIRKTIGQREGCGCMESVDIGAYNTCSNGCLYCYANSGLRSAEKNRKEHNCRNDLLIGCLKEEDKITEKLMKRI